MEKDIVEPKSVRKEEFRRNCQTLFSDQNNEKVSNLGNNYAWANKNQLQQYPVTDSVKQILDSFF